MDKVEVYKCRHCGENFDLSEKEQAETHSKICERNPDNQRSILLKCDILVSHDGTVCNQNCGYKVSHDHRCSQFGKLGYSEKYERSLRHEKCINGEIPGDKTEIEFIEIEREL